MAKQTLAPRKKPVHALNFVNSKADYEHVTGISMTVPDSTPDLRDLMRRNEGGGLISQRNDGYSDEDFPDLHQMDRLEIITLRKQLAQDREVLELELHEAAKELEKRDRQAREATIKEQNEKLLVQQKELEEFRRHKLS